MNTVQRFAPVTGRVLIAILFVLAGVNKITGYAGTQGYMEAMGLNGSLLPLVIAFEIGAGLALAVGWHTRAVAFILAGFSLVSAIIFHADLADSVQSVMFLKNVAIAGGLLAYVGFGSGSLAVDDKFSRQSPDIQA
jgi:putative oxidoreductase